MGFREVLLNNAIQEYWKAVEWSIMDTFFYSAFIVASIMFVFMVGYYCGRARENSKNKYIDECNGEIAKLKARLKACKCTTIS